MKSEDWKMDEAMGILIEDAILRGTTKAGQSIIWKISAQHKTKSISFGDWKITVEKVN